MLAPHACHESNSRGRLHPEAEDLTRGCFQRDRDRVLHSTAFRRLEYKTQVFVNHEGDHYRTRLTHSLEVAQIARSLARNLGLNEDLAEAVALSHDIGHPPFGHAGEEGLKQAMAPYGGFDHNVQALRIVTKLEHRYASFNGLNLTRETLEGMAKHNGPLAAGSPLAGYVEDPATWPSLEAQAAGLSDDIAYNNHDIDDGLRAGLFSVADLQAVPEVYAVFEEVLTLHPGLEEPRLIHEAIRRLIHRQCLDVVAETKRLDNGRVCFSEGMQGVNRRLKAFLKENMYRHYRVNRMSSKAKRVVTELFAFFFSEPECLPTEWRRLAEEAGGAGRARVVCDFIAGMTDRYALDEHRRIFDVNAKG